MDTIKFSTKQIAKLKVYLLNGKDTKPANVRNADNSTKPSADKRVLSR